MRGLAVAVTAVIAGGLIAACGSPAERPGQARTSVVVDTDMSWDDIAALTYLLERGDVDVKAIAIAGDGLAHCDPGATHVRELVAALGHAPVAIGCGRTVPLSGSAAFPEGWRQHTDAFFGLRLPAVADQPLTPTAVGVIRDALEASAKTTVVELGPMTNLAEALTADRGLAARIQRVYAMVGTIAVPGNEITHAVAEWNIFIDPLAAKTVLSSGVGVTLVPLDATDDVPVTTFFRDALAATSATRATDVLRTLFSDPYYYAGDQYFWDPAAAVVATVPALGRIAAARVAVTQGDGPERGRMAAAGDGAAIDVVENVDTRGFYDTYLETVSGDRTVKVAIPDNRVGITYATDGWSLTGAVLPAPGPAAITFQNDTGRAVYIVVARVQNGHTVADVDRLIAGSVTSVPGWIVIVLDVTTAPGHPATWTVDLQHGLYVIVGGAADLPLRRLATVDIA